MGVTRLANYFDPNERKYFISPQSVDLLIQEEKAKAERTDDTFTSASVGTVQKDSETTWDHGNKASKAESNLIPKLQNEVLDLKILNSGKDFLIKQLQQERDGFFGQLLDASRKVGELETRLLQLEGPRGVTRERVRKLSVRQEKFVTEDDESDAQVT
jgi:hypothetical protein